MSPLLSTLLAPKFIVVYVFVASALYVHFRGRVRHRFVRQLKDHSTIMAPYNTLMYLFSAVPPRPFVDVRKLPELATLLHRSDWIRTGLAGELAGFQLEDASGNLVAASQIDYQGQPAGYTAEPQDVINYAEAHDNETLFDAIQEKAPAAASTAERVRMQNLGVSPARRYASIRSRRRRAIRW